MTNEVVKETVAITNERGQTRQYETVPSRLRRFRDAYPTAKIENIILVLDDDRCLMRCEISIPFDQTSSGNVPPPHPSTHWVMLSSAHAEEYRHSSDVNMTSCLENCETSALGRALSFLGFGSEDSIASAEEVIGAKKKQAAAEAAVPGALAVLQQAAEGGMRSLESAYTDKLTKAERRSCSKFMPDLKTLAQRVDDDLVAEAAQQLARENESAGFDQS